MNGYKMTADSYRQYLEQHPDEPQEVKADLACKIKALDIMASCSDSERLQLFNTSAFNDVVKGYVKLALDNIGIEEEQRKAIVNEVSYLFDVKTADEAEQYYYSH